MRLGSLIPVLLVGTLLAGVLAWNDVLPGGWTLKGWLAPHSVRRALDQAEHSARRQEQFRGQPHWAADGVIAFLGSSTIERFPLLTLFPDKPCVNLGIGGESTPALIDRLEDSLPPGTLGGAVLYAGSIDFRARHRNPETIAALLGLILDHLRGRDPNLPIAVIGIMPERTVTIAFLERLAKVNSALESVCGARDCAFVSTARDPITSATGRLSPSVSADKVHLNREGYRHLAQWLIEDGGAVGQLLAPQ